MSKSNFTKSELVKMVEDRGAKIAKLKSELKAAQLAAVDVKEIREVVADCNCHAKIRALETEIDRLKGIIGRKNNVIRRKGLSDG